MCLSDNILNRIGNLTGGVISDKIRCLAALLAFILSFQKLNPIQEQQADGFNITQKQCKGFIHSLTMVLEEALRDACALPAATAAQACFSPGCGSSMVLHDSPERDLFSR